MAYKISKVFRCQCDFIHVTQGPCSCWVCQDSISFQLWQTGKPEPERLKKPRHNGKELNIDGTCRLFPEDPRDRTKDGEGAWGMCWPEEPGFGVRGWDWMWGAGL